MKYDINEPVVPKASDKPITATDNITPITQQRVDQIMSHLWHTDDVSLEFLNGQMAILEKRLTYAAQMSQPHMVSSLQRAIQELNVAITNNLNKQD